MGVLNVSAGVRQSSCHVRSVRGFTLIECLVVLAVTTFLVAIVVPALGNARRTSKSTRALSDLRQYNSAFSSYFTTHRDRLPFAAISNRPDLGVVIDGTSLDMPYFRQSYFALHFIVPDHLQDELPTGVLDIGDGWVAEARRRGFGASMILMTCTAFASPDYWLADDAPSTTETFVPQSVTSVAFPSQKALLYNAEHAARRSGYGFAGLWMGATFDGAAMIRKWQDPIATSVARPLGAIPALGMSTRGGLRGVDW